MHCIKIKSPAISLLNVAYSLIARDSAKPPLHEAGAQIINYIPLLYWDTIDYP